MTTPCGTPNQTELSPKPCLTPQAEAADRPPQLGARAHPMCGLRRMQLRQAFIQNLMLFEGAVLQGSHPAGLRPAYRSRSKGRIRQSGFA